MIKVDIIEHGKIKILQLSGEIDLYSSPEVRTALMKVTDQKPPAIIVHLSAVTYMDSSGLATLIEGLQKVKQYDGKFLLAGLRTEVQDVFQLSRLDKVFEIHPSLEDALKTAEKDGSDQ